VDILVTQRVQVQVLEETKVSFAQTGVCRPLGEKDDLLVCALNGFIENILLTHITQTI